MANVGNKLTSPESGWQRILCTNMDISYTSNFSFSDNTKYTDTKNEQITFYFYGTKIIILDNKTTNRSNNVQIKIDDMIETYSERGTATNNQYTCMYIKEGLENNVHKVTITNNSTDNMQRMGLQAIDIDEDGYMIYCDKNNKLYYDFTPVMTGNTTGDYVVEVSSYESSKYMPYYCFDNSFSTSWCTNEYLSLGWISIGNANKKFRINSIGISAPYNYTSVNGLTQTFKNFKVEGSNDNSTWKTINKFNTGNYEQDVIKIFNLEDIKESNYIRLYEENTENRKYICASEIKLLLDVNTPFYLIKDNSSNKIYNYDEENNQLVEVTNISILKENALYNTCIYNLNRVIPLLNSLSNDLTLLCNNNSNVVVNGIKSNKQLITAKSYFSTRLAKNIDYFELTSNIMGNSNIKMVVSIDEGLTWKTYKDGWVDLTNTISLKEYSNLTDEEKIQLNNFIDEINVNGIDSSILNTIDFNLIKSDSMMFAYVINREDYLNDCTMSKLQYQFDAHGNYKLLTTEVEIGQSIDSITVKPSKDIELMKINVGSSGNVTINNGTGELEFANSEDINSILSKGWDL